MNNENMINLKNVLAKLDVESFVQKYKEIQFEYFCVLNNVIRNNDTSEETKTKIRELSILQKLLECELVHRHDLKLEKKINKMEEEFLEENEIDFETRLGPMLDDLGEAGVLDSEQVKSSLQDLLEDWSMDIIERDIEIEDGITLDKVSKMKQFNFVINMKKRANEKNG